VAKNLEQHAARYIELREKRSALKKLYEQHDEVFKGEQKEIENHFLKYLNEQGVDSARTPAGTVYRQVEMIPSADGEEGWTSIYDFIKENDAFEMLERRIKKTFVAEYQEEHDGELPPGVKVYREYVARVRRK